MEQDPTDQELTPTTPNLGLLGAIYWQDANGKWCKLTFLNDPSIYYYDEEEKRHRLSGPAYINYFRGHFEQKWFYHGAEIKCSSQQEYEQLLKWKAFW